MLTFQRGDWYLVMLIPRHWRTFGFLFGLRWQLGIPQYRTSLLNNGPFYPTSLFKRSGAFWNAVPTFQNGRLVSCSANSMTLADVRIFVRTAVALGVLHYRTSTFKKVPFYPTSLFKRSRAFWNALPPSKSHNFPNLLKISSLERTFWRERNSLLSHDARRELFIPAKAEKMAGHITLPEIAAMGAGGERPESALPGMAERQP